MIGVKISALPAAVSAQLTDLVPVVQGGVTSKETWSQVVTLFNSNLNFLPLSGGTLTGALNLGGFLINNLGTPLVSTDAATKGYVDATTSGGFVWSVVTVDTALANNAAYFANNVGPLNFILPVTAAVGDTYAVANMNTGNFSITQNAGQTIILGNATTTAGAGGSITSTSNGDGLVIVCNVANTGFQVFPGAVGELVVV